MAAIQARLAFQNKVFSSKFIEPIAVFLIDFANDLAFGYKAWLIQCHRFFIDAHWISRKIGIHGCGSFQIGNIESQVPLAHDYRIDALWIRCSWNFNIDLIFALATNYGFCKAELIDARVENFHRTLHRIFFLGLR